MRMAVVKKSHAKVNTKSTMLIMIFCTCTKFKYRFVSLYVKQNLISEIKHLVYELSEELRQDIRLENGKYFENPNNEWRHLAPITPSRDKMLAIVAKRNNRYHIFFVPVPFCLTSLFKYFVFLERLNSRNTSRISHTYLNDSLFFLKDVNISSLKNDKRPFVCCRQLQI